MMHKRLLQLNVTANVGSTGRIAEEIGRVVIKHGWESYIAFGRDCDDSASTLIRVGNKASILQHAISARIFDNTGLLSRKATKTLISQIEQIKPSIIHLHNIHGYWINYPLLFDYLARIDAQIVWTFHDCWPFTGHCAYFFFIECQKWKTGCHDCELVREFPTSLVFDRSKCNYLIKSKCFNSLGDRLTIVPVSYWLSKLVGESFMAASRRQVIYNGVDTNRFKPLDVTAKKDRLFKGRKVVLGVASGWDNRKGLDDFIKLRKMLPDKYQIVLIGLRKNQINKLPDGVSGYEIMSSIDELIEFYNMADVVLSLSQAETFGLTIAEGMSCGTPAIVYDVTAMPELINNDVGYTIPYGDVRSVANAIEEITGREHLRLAQLCRQHVIDNFDSASNYERYYELYENLLLKR